MVDCQNLAIRDDFIPWVFGLLHYNARRLITLLNFRPGRKFVGNYTVRVTHEIHEH